MNTSSYAVKAFVGLQRSYKLDQLSYFCESCPRWKHLGYYTLMVNGKSPNAAFNGNYQLHDITCLECPYGGLCEQNIRSLPNFWGYHDGQRIRFSACPRGYCCSTAKCAGYNSCATHRTGRLCASCQAGYSEALFSARCVPDHQCGPVWIWVFFFGMGILYALFLLFQKDIRDFIFQRPENCSCGWSSGRKDNDKYSGDYSNEHRVLSEEAPDDTQPAPREENSRDTCSNHSDDRGQQQRRLVAGADCCSEAGLLGDGCSNTHTGEYFHMQTTQTAALAGTSEKTPVCDVTRTESPPEQSDTGATFLIILCYYFQDALLFNVQTVGGPRQSRAWAQARAVLLGLFKFRLEISHFVDNVCLVAGLSPWLKELAKGILVPYVILLFGVLFIANSCGRVTRSRDKWYIMAYAGICIVPFFAVLILGPGLLSDGIIGLPQFFVASLCPLPFLVYWIGRRGSREQQERSATPHQQAVLKVLQGPFKDIENKYFGRISWSGVLILRRLILILFFTFVNSSLVRILCMVIVCFVSLLHHIHVRPYKDRKGNLAGSASISALMVTGGINLIRAAFESAEYTPHGPNKTLIGHLQRAEDVLMFWLPAGIMSLVFVALFIKMGVMSYRGCCDHSRR